LATPFVHRLHHPWFCVNNRLLSKFPPPDPPVLLLTYHLLQYVIPADLSSVAFSSSVVLTKEERRMEAGIHLLFHSIPTNRDKIYPDPSGFKIYPNPSPAHLLLSACSILPLSPALTHLFLLPPTSPQRKRWDKLLTDNCQL
jgi:hypothetical protein